MSDGAHWPSASVEAVVQHVLAMEQPPDVVVVMGSMDVVVVRGD